MAQTKERERSAGRTILLKRLLVGRGMTSERMEHTLLPKVLALPIFTADALSSVAYSVESSMVVLVAAAGISSFHLVVPIQLAVCILMLIVVASYRQTVRAYRTSGGAYIVAKENLGTLPGLIAGASLLVDYVLTVSVSVASGILAITSAIPSLHPYTLELCVFAIVFIAVVNLRGVRESGVLFAMPTYGFILSMYALLVVGFIKCVGGCPHVSHVPSPILPAAGAAGISLFLILHAFSSGASALTGTEAISNAVTAFRRPQWKNAALTLGALGLIGVTLIMGTAFLSVHMGARPSEQVSVVSEVAKAVFPGSSPGSGGWMFYVLQIFTFAILILAANTSFQGFPRLSALLARDRFLPRQFENLGDRLVYSNGMVVLAIAAIVLVLAFDANVEKLLQLYVLGVFTAFTLSQSGMVVHWVKAARAGSEDAKGWHYRAAVNGVGAFATGVVAVVVLITKFQYGAWIVVVAVPLMIVGFYAIRRHYMAVFRQLRAGAVTLADAPQNIAVVYVENLDVATAEAIGYMRSFCGNEFRAFHVVVPSSPRDLAERWASFCRAAVPLEMVPGGSDPVEAAIGFVRTIPRRPSDFVTVVIPERLAKRSLLSAVRHRTTFRLKVRLLSEPQVVVADVPVLARSEEDSPESLRPLIPQRMEALVFVSSVNDATLRAIDYARSLRATDTRAVFFAFEPDEGTRIMEEWHEQRIPIALDIVEAPFRELDGPILAEVRRVTARPDSVASVILPEYRVRRWRHQLLHNQKALFIKRLLLFEDRVILSSVPYRLT